MPKVFTNTTLPASDLNTYMVQPGTAGTGTRIVAGKTAATGTSGSTNTGTINYGFTFTTAPVVTGSSVAATGAGLIVDFPSTPGTTSCTYRLSGRDTTDNLSGVAYTIHWIAVGPG